MKYLYITIIALAIGTASCNDDTTTYTKSTKSTFDHSRVKKEKKVEIIKAVPKVIPSISRKDAQNEARYQMKLIVKEVIGDEDSYDHIKSNYIYNSEGFIIQHKFSFNNAYGGRVKQTISAQANHKGQIIRMIEY